MCGIAGWVSLNGSDEAVLLRMTAAMAHRGPDAEGFHFSADRRVALGHRRLSIIDLASGAQPMANEDGSVWVTYNGEIYNFAELREDLLRRGHRFATRSDTEVILHAYEQYGSRCVEMFNGMFAFALWDGNAQRLFLARDRFGKKPLHYTLADGAFLFGSEIKALLAHPAVRRNLDPDALAAYLAHEYVPCPLTIFRGIRKLPPAHWMTYEPQTGRTVIERYWTFPLAPDPNLGEQEAAEMLLSELRGAVKRRLVSEVPLGVFLSGGIDSSGVAALMAETVPVGKLKTFNIAFTEKSYDESSYARRVAALLGSEHHEEVFSAGQMLGVLPDVIGFLDEPFADPSLLPTYMLSRFTRKHVTVALGGDGGDELFAGYPSFVASRYAHWFEQAPAPLRAMVEAVARRLPVSARNFSLDFVVRQFLKGVPYPEPLRTQVWLGAFGPSELQQLLPGQVADPFAEFRRQTDGFAQSPDELVNRLTAHYTETYMTDDILVKVDRASMACSLEVRAPLLDVRVAELAGRLPARLKLRGRQTKWLLKRALAGKLPHDILHRPKKGFGIPITQWLREDLAPLAREHLAADKLRREGLFDANFVQMLLDEHQRGARNHRKPLWTLLVFELWAARHLW
ncbi:MAG: asparagine synthase (glutamine-hydrolyzing) [Verrucomicrobia bacterium]|nr:asparagine synthase (glutamine-hydrolyzing) [Verrucomicrobiota bacterium]